MGWVFGCTAWFWWGWGGEREGRVEEDGEGGHRFRLLESMRDFALEQVTSCDEGDAVARAHAQYFLELAERAKVIGDHLPAVLLDRRLDLLLLLVERA